MHVKNHKRVPSFTFFGTLKLFLHSHFSSEIRFSQYISNNSFFNTIRIFDVISELYCVLLQPRKRRRRFENKRTHSSLHETFGCSDTFMWVFHLKSLEFIFKTLRFWALNWTPTWDVLFLFMFWNHHFWNHHLKIVTFWKTFLSSNFH